MSLHNSRIACDSEGILEGITLFTHTDIASDSSMSSPFTELPRFDDIIWIALTDRWLVASRLVSYPASLKRASPSTELAHFHVILTPI